MNDGLTTMCFDYQIKTLEQGGATFAIYAVNLTLDCQDYDWSTSSDVLYLREGETFPYLYYFLNKNFKKSLQFLPPYFSPTKDWLWSEEKFEWYDNNYYTFEQIQIVLQDIRNHIVLLKNDFNNPALDDLKQLFLVQQIDYDFLDLFYPDLQFDTLTKGEQIAFIQTHLPIIIDFYERIIARLDKMMKDNPHLNFICFSGP